MANPPVEARSLSDINSLAANPPQYPNNPTHKGHEDLTLYISRVPGARDVILSTLRPQRKNVSPEDVKNSLYYIHLNHPDEELLVPPKPIRDEGTPRSSAESSRSNRSSNMIKRKPLPANARVISRHGSEDSTTTGNTGNPGNTSITANEGNTTSSSNEPKGVRFLDVPTEIPSTTSYSAPSSPHPSKAMAIPLRPHPNGPRPQGSAHYEPPPSPSFDDILGGSSIRSSSPGRASSLSSSPSQAPPLPPRPDTAENEDQPQPQQPFSLTLIRRDPSSSLQWNVGKVSMEVDISNQSEHHVFNPIDVHLENSGYAKFRGMPSKAHIESNRLSTSSLSLSLPKNVRQEAKMTIKEGFHRQVAMGYTKGVRAGIMDKIHRHRADSDARHRSDSDVREPNSHRRQDSMNSISSADSAAGSPPSQTVLDRPAHRYKQTGYMFQSPWDGRCEFRTGHAGRTLKLRHVLPEAVATGDPDPMKQFFGPGTVAVSELRFSLPTAELFGDGKRGKIARDAQEKFNKYVWRTSQYEESGDEDADEWADIEGVGREDAGGGSKGKRVKMGKLVVHDEGMKMLDLVIAANVGVWWTSWERLLA